MSAEPEPQPERIVRLLWQRMVEIFGHRWTSAYGDDAGAAGGTWAKGLSGLTVEQVSCGVAACIASADGWPPSLPEFRAMCLNIPTLAAIRIELGDRNSDRSRFAHLVWSKIDAYRWRLVENDRAERMLRDAYDLAREHVMRGGTLPEPAAALLDSPSIVERKAASPEIANKALSDLKTFLGAAPRPEDFL